MNTASLKQKPGYSPGLHRIVLCRTLPDPTQLRHASPDRIIPNRTMTSQALLRLTTPDLTGPSQSSPSRAMPYVSEPCHTLPNLCPTMPKRAIPDHAACFLTLPNRTMPHRIALHRACPNLAPPHQSTPHRIMPKSTLASSTAKVPWRLHPTSACYGPHLRAAHGTPGRATGDC